MDGVRVLFNLGPFVAIPMILPHSLGVVETYSSFFWDDLATAAKGLSAQDGPRWLHGGLPTKMASTM
eukprot:7866111-Pyramimonas_sp.AAC.1